MNNLKVGIDNVFIERLKGKEERFSKRILSSKELVEYNKSFDKTEFIASHFAAKEAYIKASKNKNVILRDIELLHDSENCPHIYYQGKECGVISVTHDVICSVIVILND